jgi:hypothetical protein
MADEFTAVIGEMFRDPPDRNGRLPLANHKGTMFGVTIPFHVGPSQQLIVLEAYPLQVLCWIFVAFRLHTRLRVVREPGLDDLFVFLAAVFNLISLVSFLYGQLLRLHIVVVVTNILSRH